MLVVSPMEATSFSMAEDHEIDFPEFSGQGGCLDSIDFDELFVGIHFDGDELPEMEMDPELVAEFSIEDLEEDSATSLDTTNIQVVPNDYRNEDSGRKVSGCVSDEDSIKFPMWDTNSFSTDSKLVWDEGGDNNHVRVSDSEMETEAEKEKEDETESEKSRLPNLRAKKREKTKETSSLHADNNNNNSKNNTKRKTKVDWTPDLHRRFVQAVEQLGVDKAVPSRILELMGISRLTRHNIASHLQKYRTHRRHLLAREAEAASWSQKRQVYGAIAVAPPTSGGGSGKVKAVNHPWRPPTIGFPPPMTPPPPHHHHHPAFQPLHVWGHPTHHREHQPMMPVWPKQLAPSPSPLPHTSFWPSHHQYRFAPPLVQGIPPPHATMYKPEHGVATPTTSQPSPNHPPTDLHPTKERIDEAIGDALSKPWLPLPIGLKPPSIESVIGELQRQGVPNIPPSKSS